MSASSSTIKYSIFHALAWRLPDSFRVILDGALNFVARSDSRLASKMVQRWYQVLGTHQNAAIFAVNYDEARLRAKILLLWRLRFRSNLQSLKVARWADRFFATRRAWRLWLEKMDERKRLDRFKAWNVARVRRAFNGKCKA